VKNFIVIVLDGVGIGELPDASRYGDQGSNTLSNMAEYVGGLNLPNLQKLGLGNIASIKGLEPVDSPLASFGKMMEVSIGKDSTTGHWELGGLHIDKEFPLYPDGFPQSIINKFIEETEVEGVLGNIPASGTEIIERLGEEHLRTSFPIVYTSADSVFQIAAHEEVIPLNRLYKICEIARKNVLTGKDAVARVIARPFIGTPGKFTRTTNRKDFSLDPFGHTILDYLYYNKIDTIAIGKINDLFNYRGIKTGYKTRSNSEGMERLLQVSSNAKSSFIFVNLVDFDVYYGHRNDPYGFAGALKEFDEFLPLLLNQLDASDRLVITADHGNDPTTPSTDHSREFVPLLFYSKDETARNLGIRNTFADVAQTIAHYFKVNNDLKGKSFLYE